jgi:FKBP-type peptidyl-prolyl cis-trans isomerase
MKRTISYLLFAVLAVALIWVGMIYNDNAAKEADQQALKDGQAAQIAQYKLMEQLKKTDTTIGTGQEAKSGDTVSVLYTGSLDDGTVFDASSKHGNQPFSFLLGGGQVIPGWDLGVVGMKVGGTRRLDIPAELAYGNRAVGPIPANSPLHFVIQLIAVSSTASGQ